MNDHILKSAIPLAVALAVLGSGVANAHPDDRTAMPLGAATTAPQGFVEMCERAPEDCLSVARGTPEMLSEVRSWAGHTRWASVFQSTGISTAPASVPAAGEVDEPRPVRSARVATIPPTSTQALPTIQRAKTATPADVRALKNENRKRRPSRPSKTSPVVPPATPPSVATPAITMPPPRPVADVSMAVLESVTRRINRAIGRSSDADAYGREDVWVLPQGRRPTGDCEDYVLAKRRALIDEGVDPAALSIAIVRTRRGEVHAVLLVATPEGEQVLDNLTPWVVSWRDAPYDWLERQAPGQPLVWIRAAT